MWSPATSAVPGTGEPPALWSGADQDRVFGWRAATPTVDLHGDPRHGRVAGATMAEAVVATCGAGH